ncbi:hypothetical protein PT974_01815 [Cladobotryum mycophilum]|uniref:Uncharacterized protein n=1 Tax=Cladobotryum mycophilum TaxID=491253 RepID=A0ABR0SXG8_9HYPO
MQHIVRSVTGFFAHFATTDLGYAASGRQHSNRQANAVRQEFLIRYPGFPGRIAHKGIIPIVAEYLKRASLTVKSAARSRQAPPLSKLQDSVPQTPVADAQAATPPTPVQVFS